MKSDSLDDVFRLLGVKERSKLGSSTADDEIRRNAEKKFKNRRSDIQKQLKDAAQLRTDTVKRLNIFFYVVIFSIIICIVVQLVLQKNDIILYVQTACVAVLFPISRRIERSITQQSHIEFIAAFLPDLEPQEAIKAIDQLYQSLTSPKSLKQSINL